MEPVRWVGVAAPRHLGDNGSGGDDGDGGGGGVGSSSGGSNDIGNVSCCGGRSVDCDGASSGGDRLQRASRYERAPRPREGAGVAASWPPAAAVPLPPPPLGSPPPPPDYRELWTDARWRPPHNVPAARAPSWQGHCAAATTAAAGRCRHPAGLSPSLPLRGARTVQPPLCPLLLLLLLVLLLGGGSGVTPVITPVGAAGTDTCNVLSAETCASSCVPFEDGRDFRCSDWFYTERCCNGTVAVFPSEKVYYRCSCDGVGLTGQGLAVIGCSVLAGLAAAVAVGVYVLCRRRKRLDAEAEERVRAVEEATSYLPR